MRRDQPWVHPTDQFGNGGGLRTSIWRSKQSIICAIELDGEHTPLAGGFRRPAETLVTSGTVSGEPPDTARGPRALPALDT